MLRHLKIILGITPYFGFAVAIVNCTKGTTVLPSAPAAQSQNTPTAVSAQVSGLINYGVETNGLLQVELDGTFSGTFDTVNVTCINTTNVVATVISDTPSMIMITLTPLNDSCTFSVQNSNTASSPNSTAVTFTTTQSSLSIQSAKDNGQDATTVGDDDIVLNGKFAGTTDQVFVGCDGNNFNQVAAANISTDTTAQIALTIPTPLNFTTCQFYVADNGVQSSIMTVLLITNASDQGPDLTATDYDDIALLGTFTSATDEVWASCDGGSFVMIPNARVSNDSTTKLEFLMPTPNNFNSCQFYISNAAGNDASATYTVFGLLSVWDQGTSATVAGSDNVSVYGNFYGSGDQVWVGCDGDAPAQLSNANVSSDTVAEIDFTLPTPISLNSCQFYVINGGEQTATISP